MATKATDDAAAIIANEPSLEAKHLQELIDQRVNERSKKLEKELESIKQRLHRSVPAPNQQAKNKLGGEKQPRALKKKSKAPSKPAVAKAQKQTKTPPTGKSAKKKKQPQAQSATAEGANNVTSNDNKNVPTKATKKTKDKKKKGLSTSTNKQKRRPPQK
jgi:hypothetical protein